MPHLLEQRMAQLRARAYRLSVLYGVSRVVGLVVVAVLLLGFCDYLIRYRDPGIRLLASLAVVLAGGWACLHYLRPVVGRRLVDLDMARKVEQRFPRLNDRLSSAVEFLRQSSDDRTAGSADLRRALIIDATAAVEQLDLDEVLDLRPTRRAVRWAGGIVLAALLITLLDPLSARLAVARLLRPWGGDAWPRQHNLTVVDPVHRLTAGQTFEIEACDRSGAPPAEVRVHYRYDNDGRTLEEVEPMHLLDGALLARKENVSRPFEYRVEGGDDQSMEWIGLEVVEPPRIVSLQTILHPPAYTGWPVEPVENNLHALRGTRVALDGSTTKIIRAATVYVTDGPALECVVKANGFGFELAADAARPFVVEKTGSYSIELTGSEGLTSGRETVWEIHAVADQAPSVTIEQPVGDVFVTPGAMVPLRIMAKDDLALREIALHESRSATGDTDDRITVLYAGPTLVEPTTGSLSAGLPGESQVVAQTWDLAPLNLKPGSQLTFFATAGDYLPQEGRSTDRKLIVISAQELEDRVAQRQGLILGELRRALKMQQETRGQTKALEIQLRELGRLAKQDVDHAQGAELNQRQITRTLTSPTEGLPAQIKDMLADLVNNRLENADVEHRLQGVLDELNGLEKDHLAPSQRELTAAIKGAQADLEEAGVKTPDRTQSPAVGAALTSAGEHQDQVVRSLESMLERLAEWDNYRRFAREVAQIEHDLQDLQQNIAQAAPRSLGKDLKDLDAQQLAELKKIASRQSELGRQFDKLLQQMEAFSRRLDVSDPLASATLDDALHLAREKSTSAAMRLAVNQLERNQLGQARKGLEQAGQDLAELLDVLANRSERELGRLLKKLQAAEQDLARLRAEHRGLHDKAARLAAQPAADGAAKTAQQRGLERLAQQERKLQAELGRLGRQLERLQAERAGRSAESAAAHLGRQADAIGQADPQDAQEQPDLADLNLAAAQKQLAEKRRQVEADLAQAQMARLRDALTALHKRQEQVLAETIRLEDARSPGWIRGQAASVQELSREQQHLIADTQAQRDKLIGAEVFQLALGNAIRDMQAAAILLDQSQTGAAPQKAEIAARDRLAGVLEAFRTKPSSEAPKNSGNSPGEGQPQANPNAIHALMELKLLKIMQEDVNHRSAELEMLSGPQAALERAALIAEQGRLAEIALKLSQPVDQNPEDDPDSLPDLRSTPEKKGEE